jgi:negative regulator of flagellin synthesis FlgM
VSSSKVSAVTGRGTPPVGAGGAAQRPQSGAQGGASQSPRSDSSASVEITGAASQLAELEQALRTYPAIDESRVATISLALEQGGYTISPEHIADQLMYLEYALSGLPPVDES